MTAPSWIAEAFAAACEDLSMGDCPGIDEIAEQLLERLPIEAMTRAIAMGTDGPAIVARIAEALGAGPAREPKVIMSLFKPAGRPIGLDPGPFAEQLRRAHCAHAQGQDPGHVCVGTCTLSRTGITLDCKPCGAGAEPLAPLEAEAADARAVVEAAGMCWRVLTPEAQRAAVAAFTKRSAQHTAPGRPR